MAVSVNGRIRVKRSPARLVGNPTRVITRTFLPTGRGRIRKILDRVMDLSETEVGRLLAETMSDFAARHKDVEKVFADHFAAVARYLDPAWNISEERRLLIGAFFTCEYSLESVALFNPCIVPHANQDGVEPGSLRFVMSLRACGEGHISSIAFRTGVVDAAGDIALDPVTPHAITEKPVEDKLYKKHPFLLKLIEMGVYNQMAGLILAELDDRFTFNDLRAAIEAHSGAQNALDYLKVTTESMLWLARSNYHLDFPAGSEVSERVIFPVAENESRGIEDARFVRFTDDDGRAVYYASYSAYNGFKVLPMFIETPDFTHFKIITLNGKFARNKGLALFPRKIAGAYAMIGRPDGENLHLLHSDNIHFWNEGDVLHVPMQPWELVQVGNCGSPIETDEGWLLLTHGVGPMRRYCIGALLLDLEDPRKVISHLKDPILTPTERERDGYVPNVVYSCGAMIHNGNLILPYAVADTSAGIATVPLADIMANMTR